MIRSGLLKGGPPAVAAPEALAWAASGGDEDAFAALVTRYQRRVLGFAYHHLRDPSEAQDLAQEIFVRLHRGLRRFDSSRPFEPWFWRLAGNVALTYRRRRAADPAAADPPAGLAAPVSDDGGLGEALAALPPEARLPLLLHYFSGLSLEEVAAVMEITLPALKSRMHRTRAVLREVLEAAT